MSRGVVRVGVNAVGLLGPGLPGWMSSRAVLAGDRPYHPTPVELPPPNQLSPAERRRAIPSVKLALAVGAAAVEQSGHDPKALPAVFASSGADGETITAIMSALVTPAREVSPTRFHNSVHNAPSGYWSIAVQSQEAVTSVSCYDASFAAGLLEAGVQAVCASRPVLLVAYDLPYPDPLDRVRPIIASFGIAFVLSPVSSAPALAALDMTCAPAAPASRCIDQGLEQLRRGNPAARSLPLLTSLAARRRGDLRLDLGHGTLELGVTAC